MSDQSQRADFQPVMGLEIHVQLQTNSKVFSPEGFVFGAEPNTHVSAVTMAHPGALPTVNHTALRYAIKMGLALNCEIARYTYFDRKNYFYPDLPKGYQLSQDKHPICGEGHFDLRLPAGEHKRLRIERIHLEEDAGKSIHDQAPGYTLVDLNRAGVPLIEIVTHPDLRTAEEASLLMTEMRRIVRYLGISDGDMEKGNLRCDANVSVMRKDATQYGTRVEIKNINSFNFVKAAIEYEIDRQIALILSGGKVERETRTYDPQTGTTLPMRDKETAQDYRYFPEPDLLPVIVTEEVLEQLRAEQPVLPSVRLEQYQYEWGLPENESITLVERRDWADYLEAMVAEGMEPKAAASWLLGPLRTYLNEHNLDLRELPLQPIHIAGIGKLVQDGLVSFSAAKEYLFPAMLKQADLPAFVLAQELGVLLDTNNDALSAAIERLIVAYPDEYARYRSGKKGLSSFFVGHIMKEFKGKADPKEVNKLVLEKLDAK